MKNIILCLMFLLGILFSILGVAASNPNIECKALGLEIMIKDVDQFYNQEKRNHSYYQVNHITDYYINPTCDLLGIVKIMLDFGFKVYGQSENEIELKIPLLKNKKFLLFRPDLRTTIKFKNNKINEVYSRIANVMP